MISGRRKSPVGVTRAKFRSCCDKKLSKMSENNLISKLKRKKSYVEGQQAEITSRAAVRRVFSSGDFTSQPGRSVAPAAAWWRREQLPAVERLWALTLKSAPLHLEDQHSDPVPDLPSPSTERPTALKLDDEWWCDFSEEVAPFPEPIPPPPASSPDPLQLSSSQQDLSVQTKPVPDPPDRPLSSHSRHTSHSDKTTSLSVFTKQPRPSLSSREAAASSAGPSGVGGDISKHVSLREMDENMEMVVEEEEEAYRSVRGDGEAAGGGGAGLQSCPMCLLVFPAGFTQMDCDGHLAQCLSEVNVDVTW